jgi:DNA processing protein
MVSVVGAREVQDWVVEWLENELAPALSTCEIGVVSGGARGVDQVAHRIAIRKKLPTVVVLPSGLREIYPKNIASWVGRDQTLFMSEYSDEQAMRNHHFFYRNRLIVGLTPVTLIVQAKEKSGTMISARFAIEQGRTVATLPAFPIASAFSGNNQLLADGALMVRGQKDLLALLSSSFFSKE